MKFKALALSLIVTFTVGCAGSSLAPKAPANLAPAVTAAFYATYAIKDLDIVRDFAVDANQTTPPLLSKASTLAVVKWHEALINTIHSAPAGWKAAVTAGLTQLPTLMSAAEYAKIKPYANSVQTLVTEVQ